jgi:hypothetical protein
MTSADTFHAAAKRADVAELRRLLRVDATLARSRDAGGRTVLHHLAGGGGGDAGGGDARGDAAALEALTLLRAHDVDLDDINPKTGAPMRCCACAHHNASAALTR